MRTLLPALIALSLIAPAASASSWVVGPYIAPGVDFTDIASAISAAAPGDVIEVRAGIYTGFTLNIGLSILGDPGTSVSGHVRVLNVPSGPRATLADLSMRSIEVRQCAAAVTLEHVDSVPYIGNLTGAGVTAAITITDCSDVRLRDVSIGGNVQGTYAGMSIGTSRVEMTHSSVYGIPGHSHDIYQFPGAPEDGGDGISVLAGADLHISSSVIVGGGGGSLPQMNLCQSCSAGDGGAGIRVSSNGRVNVTGPMSTIVRGGHEGTANYCSQNGVPGNGIISSPSASLRVSHVAIVGESSFYGCLPPSAPIEGPYALVSPSDPTLTVNGTIQQGQPVTFTVRGVPGESVRLFLGRQLTVIPVAGSYEDQLLVPLRGQDLGTLPAAGFATYTLTLPSSLPKGTMIVAQARTTSAGGTISMTGSVPITLR